MRKKKVLDQRWGDFVLEMASEKMSGKGQPEAKTQCGDRSEQRKFSSINN